MALGNPHIVWKGPQIVSQIDMAVNRALVAVGEVGVAEAKTLVHRLTGTLSRSIHLAPPDYSGGNDESMAPKTDIAGALDMDLPVWDAPHNIAALEVGSWLPYAAVEEITRGHLFLGPAMEIANRQFQTKLRTAMITQGFAEGGFGV